MLRRGEMRTGLTAVAVVFVLALAACSGDGGDGEAETQFQAQVNEICADYGPKLALIPPPAEDVDEWAAIGADMSDLLEASVNELRLLVPPEGLAEDFGDWLALRTEMATTMRDVQAAGGLHDEPAVDDGLARVNEAMTTADPLAEQLGFEDCSPTGIETGGELPEK
jgi:hypothetical protein